LSSDSPKDVRGLRLFLCFLGICLMALLLWLLVSARPEWKAYQKTFREIAKVPPDQAYEIAQIDSCTGEVDRCMTCHGGMERTDLSDPKIPLPFRAHSKALGPHPVREMGCSSCHGGVGRALDKETAHAMPGTEGKDPLLKTPYLQASCSRCHVPGDGEGMEHLVRGANLFVDLGCMMCHPLSAEGRGGWDYGPDLKTLGRKSVHFLETSLLDPTANFSESTMPSFAATFTDNHEALTDLVVFLMSLPLERPSRCNLRVRSDALLDRSCTLCHAGPDGVAQGRFTHRCVYIKDHPELKCGNCHKGELPAVGREKGFCPFVKQARPACDACHDRAREGRTK
jgi:hypothetical protein